VRPAPAPYVPPPLTLLPATLRKYVEAAAKAINVDVSYVLLPLLGSLGSVIGNTRSILLKPGFIQPPVIWTGIIGRSGQKKSPSIEAGVFAVWLNELALRRDNKQAKDKYDDELADWDNLERKDRLCKQKPVAPIEKTCWMDNLTPEKLADNLEANSHGVLVRKDELSHWLASFDQYHSVKGSDVSLWLSLHTGVSFAFDRRTDHRSYRIPNPRVCITGGIQPQVLKRALTVDFFERGLPARFLFAAPPARQDKWSEAVVPECLSTAVLELFNELWLLQPEHDEYGNQKPILLTLEPDARAAYVAYYNECGAASMGGDERAEAAWNKLSGYAARLALVIQLAANPHATTITGEVMRGACDLARWFGNENVRIYASFSETTEQREQRQLVEFIQSRGGLASVRDVTHYCWAFKGQTDKVEAMFNALVKEDRAKWLEPKEGGRGQPARKIQLLSSSPSPLIHDLRGETPNTGDGDALSTQKNTHTEKPNTEAVSASKAPMVL